MQEQTQNPAIAVLYFIQQFLDFLKMFKFVFINTKTRMLTVLKYFLWDFCFAYYLLLILSLHFYCFLYIALRLLPCFAQFLNIFQIPEFHWNILQIRLYLKVFEVTSPKLQVIFCKAQSSNCLIFRSKCTRRHATSEWLHVRK